MNPAVWRISNDRGPRFRAAECAQKLEALGIENSPSRGIHSSATGAQLKARACDESAATQTYSICIDEQFINGAVASRGCECSWVAEFESVSASTAWGDVVAQDTVIEDADALMEFSRVIACSSNA